eukprot:937492-Heterocapsa_arctica.AAC.1
MADLIDLGFLPDFAPPASLVRHGLRLPLVAAGVLYYLPVHVSWASSRRVKEEAPEPVAMVVNAVVDNPIT